MVKKITLPSAPGGRLLSSEKKVGKDSPRGEPFRVVPPLVPPSTRPKGHAPLEFPAMSETISLVFPVSKNAQRLTPLVALLHESDKDSTEGCRKRNEESALPSRIIPMICGDNARPGSHMHLIFLYC